MSLSTGLPKSFDPKRSKYSPAGRKPEEQLTGEIPPYLEDEAKFKDLISSDFVHTNPETAKNADAAKQND